MRYIAINVILGYVTVYVCFQCLSLCSVEIYISVTPLTGAGEEKLLIESQ